MTWDSLQGKMACLGGGWGMRTWSSEKMFWRLREESREIPKFSGCFTEPLPHLGDLS